MYVYPKPASGLERIVFDLDGTLAESVWPDRTRIGNPIPQTVELLRHYAACGYTIVIETARRPIDEELIWKWVKEHQLPVDYVRCGKKLVAALYVDDKAYKPPWLDGNNNYEPFEEEDEEFNDPALD